MLLVQLALLASAETALADDFVIVRNAKNPAKSVSRSELKKLFTGQSKQWGAAVTQTVLGEPDTPELAWLAGRVFGVSPKDLLTKIKQEIFRGEMKRPVMVHSSEDCATAVQKSEGGIGVVTGAAAKSLPAGVAVTALTD
jgi:ABC-type phosphate transport system substrate-binding protein